MNHPNVETIDQYTCPNCDGNLIFDPNSQSLKCPYCETLVSLVSEEMVEEYEFERYKQQGLTWDQDVHSFQCEACGASLVTEAHISSLNCPYCGSSHVIQLNLPIGLRPEGVLPFRIDKQEAFQRFTQWLPKQWLAPNDLKRRYRANPPSGVYLPYWTYDAQTKSTYHGRGGKYYYTTRRVNGRTTQTRHTRWYSVTGHIDHSFDDVCVCASSRFEDEFLDHLAPFRTKCAVPYDGRYLSGYAAEHGSLSVEEGLTLAKEKMKETLESLAESEIERTYDTSCNIHLRTSYTNVTFKQLLIPIWASTYDYKGKTYHYLINGDTGKVYGKTPVSVVKVIFLTLFIAIIVFYLLWGDFFLTYY